MKRSPRFKLKKKIVPKPKEHYEIILVINQLSGQELDNFARAYGLPERLQVSMEHPEPHFHPFIVPEKDYDYRTRLIRVCRKKRDFTLVTTRLKELCPYCGKDHPFHPDVCTES